MTDSLSDQLHDTLPALGEESSHPEHTHTQHPGQIHFSGVQQVVITSICATDLTLGLQCIPAGFHGVVKADGAEYQTSNQSVHVDQAVSRMAQAHSSLTSRDMDGTQNSMDLDQSISHFERASDLCPVNHSYHPAALLNLAMAKFISCQANGRYLNLNIPISLFQEALDLRPIGHPDQPMTQLHLAISLLSHFARWGFQIDADTAEELLSNVLDVCHTNSHFCRATLIAIKTSAVHGSK
ncbi:hypothetical protein EV424DRAFT_1547951 [Suillus variegatus]|nr:hypothetical protein EV424DRAFT_1547951 [Suillus variegatus]